MADEVKTSAGADGRSPGRAQAEGLGGGKFKPSAYNPQAGTPKAEAGGTYRDARPSGATTKNGVPMAPTCRDPQPFRNTKQVGPETAESS